MFRLAAENSELVDRTKILEGIYREFFRNLPAFKASFAHSPHLLPYVYYRWRDIEPAEVMALNPEIGLVQVKKLVSRMFWANAY